MSIQKEIDRINQDKTKIRSKLINLGLATTESNLDDCATAVDSIENRGAISASVMEGETYTIPKGYHNGSGTVSGVVGGGNYDLQSKEVTPTKSQQNITPDSGYYGLSDVTVQPIPSQYQDVSPVTATAADVLATKIVVDKTGKQVAGTMPNNGAVTSILSPESTEYAIPKGYHSGLGKVSIVPEEKSIIPTKNIQEIEPTVGKVLSKVIVDPIPETYIDTTNATAVSGDILSGKTAYVKGSKITGTMINNGPTNKTMDGLTATSVSIPSGYTTGGTVSLTADIEEALSEI